MRQLSINLTLLFLVTVFSHNARAEEIAKCGDIKNDLYEASALSWYNKHKVPSIIELLTKISKEDLLNFYELGPQRLPLAVSELKSLAFVQLDEKKAKYYNPHYESIENMVPYLVRGVFSNYTGTLFVFQKDNNLVVGHSSLGAINCIKFTPIIVNLKSEPTNLILNLHSAN